VTPPVTVGLTAPTTQVTTSGDTSQVRIKANDVAIATADVTNDGSSARLQFQVAAGHLPPTTRRQLVHAVFELPALRRRLAVRASIPLGDVDLLLALRQYCFGIQSRAAGATCLVDGIVEPV
jgi:hypothetical protein